MLSTGAYVKHITRAVCSHPSVAGRTVRPLLLALDGLSTGLIALSLVLQLGAIVVPPILAFKWMFKDGMFGSVKLVLMEVAHYQKLTSNKALHRIADAAAE